jgi:ribosome assembly protein 4
MLNHNQLKISEFRAKVSSYRTSTISASQLIDSFFSLFDVPAADLGKLIKELADIYESDDKRNDLLKAWNDWRAINEDYPTLPGPSGILPGSSAAPLGSGRRVLKLKAQHNNRRAQQLVDKAAGATHLTPSLSHPCQYHQPIGRSWQSRSTPWVTTSTSSAFACFVATVLKPRLQSCECDKLRRVPALPAAAKPNTTMFGYTSGAVRWNQNRDTPPTILGATASSGASHPPAANGNEDENDVVAGSKKRVIRIRSELCIDLASRRWAVASGVMDLVMP